MAQSGPSLARLRVGVVGARRHHQGIGHHLARFCGRAGAEVVGIVGTSERTVAEARGALAGVGLDPRGHLDARSLLDEDRPDVLVVASPSRTHETYLRLALARGLHVLCEKPLCWGGEDADERARALADAFVDGGLHLVVNAQWPWTLETYRRLYPGVLDDPPRSFFMRLSPNRTGAEMLPDALPHALSLLAAGRPDPAARVARPAVCILAEDESHLRVTFDYAAAGGVVAAEVELRRGRQPPREAAFGFDGRLARRRVDVQGYRLFLEGEGRRVSLPDPTERLVRAFLARVSSGEPPRVDPCAWPGMGHLVSIRRAWPGAPAARESDPLA